MSNRRKFMSKLQFNAQTVEQTQCRKRKMQPNIRAESPLPRELTEEETLLLDEIIEDSDQETCPVKNQKIREKLVISKSKRDSIKDKNTYAEESLHVLDTQINTEHTSSKSILSSNPPCLTDASITKIQNASCMKTQNEQLSSSLQKPDLYSTQSLIISENQNVSESSIITQSKHPSSLLKKNDLISTSGSTETNIIDDQNMYSESACIKIRSEQPPALIEKSSSSDSPANKDRKLSEVHSKTQAKLLTSALQNTDLLFLSSSCLIDIPNNEDHNSVNPCNKTPSKELSTLRENSISNTSAIDTVNIDQNTPELCSEILNEQMSTPLENQCNQTSNLTNTSVKYNPIQLQNNINLSVDSRSDEQNDTSTAEFVLISGCPEPNDSIFNCNEIYEDPLYNSALLHSVNPTLGKGNILGSPSILKSNSVDENMLYESPGFSPYISQQLLHLGGDMTDSPAPKTPSEAAASIASPLPQLPLDSRENGVLININSGSPPPKVVAKRKRQVSCKKDKGRVRTLHKDQWKDVQRKTNRNSGREYRSRNGKLRNEKKLGPTCKESCKLKCNSKFNMEQRESLFTKFWKMGDLVRHWDYITKYCRKISKRRITTETDSRRQYTIQYYLPAWDETTGNQTKFRVCKTMFLNTFDIKEGLVYSAFKKLSTGGTVAKDERGLHINHKKVITEEMKSSVCDHISSFTPVEAHYVRSDSTKLYLDGSLSIAKMFRLYLKWDDENCRAKVETERQYRDILNENFNLAFHIPKKDQCDVCVEYKHSEKPVTVEEYEKYTTHIRNKNIAREMKNKDKENAKNNKEDTIAAVYDFQKVHGLPHGETSILYYKRKLSVFNFTVYDLGNGIGTCYVWDESTARRGSVEVASCIYDFIEKYNSQGIKNFYFFSDNCGGQNRNRIVFAAYMRAARDFKVTVTHKYLEKGHTQNEGDSVHALIEKSAKNKMVFTPDQWFALIRWAKQDDKPYIVKEMNTMDFLDFKILLPNCNWTKDLNDEIVYWSQLRQLEILPEESERIYFKTDFCSHDFKCIIVDNYEQGKSKRVRNRGKGKEVSRIPMHSRRLQPAYQNKLPIPKAKKNDLKYLCQHKIIPSKYHDFYENLVEGEVDNIEEEIE